MATGIQSSANVPGSPAALDAAGILPAQPQTLQQQNVATMQKNQEDAADSKKVSAKVYHSFAGSTYYDKTGVMYQFDHKGELSVDSEVVQKDLDLVSDKPGSPIYSKNQRPTPAPGDDEPVRQIQNKAAQTMAELQKQAKV